MSKAKMKQEEKIVYMTTRPVKPLICELAVPTIISMLVTTFYNVADTFFVGKINTQATAATGIVFSIMTFIQAVSFFFGHGSGNYISRKLGAREFKEANIMASDGFFGAFIAGAAIEIAGLIFLEPIAVFLGSTPTILPYTKTYLSIILLGTPFVTSSFVLNNQLRFQGSASYAMVGIVSGAVLNVFLDPLFIFVFRLGIRGAAWATIISQICSFILLFIGSYKGGNIHIHFRNFHPTFYYLKEITRGGFPSLCRQGLASVSGILLNHAAAAYGGIYQDAAIAGFSIVSRFMVFANSALIGFGQGFQPVCAMNYGAGKYDRVREAFKFCVKYATLFLILVAIGSSVFAEKIVTLFRDSDPDVIKIGTLVLRLQSAVLPFSAWIILSNMMLQSIGKAVKASLVAASRHGLFFIPLIFILPKFLGLFGVQICQTVSDTLSLLLSIPLTLSVLKEMKNQA